VLTERGLAPAVAALAARAPVPVDLVELPVDRLPSALEATAYFTVSEALTNVAKYAGATCAAVRVASEGQELVVEIRDDGVGGASPAMGSGLTGLADRIGAIDGTLTVNSPPGEGTLVRAVLPIRVGSGRGGPRPRSRDPNPSP
jgi:signal transduction histidine kinase